MKTSAKPVAKAVKKTKEYKIEESKLMQLFVAGLKDIYWAEKALTKAIPKMIKNASAVELIDVLENHLGETEDHVKKAEQVFDSIKMKPAAKKCEAMAGLVKEAEEIMATTDRGGMRDAGIISAAQKVEHYEIASYGTLKTFAATLNLNTAFRLLDEVLNEEKTADQKLTEIAKSTINIQTANAY